MDSKRDFLKLKSKIIEICKSISPPLIGLWVYGSYAQKRNRTDSDLDLAVLSESPISKEQLNHLMKTFILRLNFQNTLDLVDLKNIPLTLAMEILKDGILIYVESSKIHEIDKWENVLMSMYVQLNEERKEIIKDIIARGSVYE